MNLVDCVEVSRVERLGGNFWTQTEKAFGNYEKGRFGWITDGLFRLDYPVPYVGGQGLRILPTHVCEQIKEQGWKP